LDKVKDVEEASLEILEKGKKTLSLDELVEAVEKELKEKNITSSEIRSYLRVLAKIRSNRFEKWGITKWPEIEPKNTRDKIYLILKENRKPLHFREIAEKIDEFGLSKKKAHPQTVHNELIKDKRFVLIGRGIYAVAEWGYSKGTVRDVLREILEKNGPLSKEEIFKEVFKKRKVKKATVMINLNNSQFFVKKGNIYSLKK
jgi:DNA-directed RNA polymerase delta subunit